MTLPETSALKAEKKIIKLISNILAVNGHSNIGLICRANVCKIKAKNVKSKFFFCG